MNPDKSRYSRLLTRSDLRNLAGDVYFERGLAYFDGGAVVHLVLGRDGISARVQGSSPCPYSVRFWIENRLLQWGCACPLGSEGSFCKHLVAAGLAFARGKFIGAKEEAVPPEIMAMLNATDERTLFDIVGRRALWDESMLAELALAARASPRDKGSKRPRGPGLPGRTSRPVPRPIER